MSTLSGILCPILLTINYTILTSGALLLLGLCYALYITLQKNKQLRIASSLMQARQAKLALEKEWLMKEVHHRVRNNLQLVISLLNMQTGYMKDEFALDAFGDIGSRIRAISLIHQRMYQEGNDMATIDMQDYITELAGSFSTGPFPDSPVSYRLDISSIELDVSQSVPVGLILNEAITNAIKHAFPRQHETSPGQHETSIRQHNAVVGISMSQQDDSLILLTVSDNGRGLPENFNLEANATMGLQLIKTLSDQLDGSLQLENRNGFTLTLQFARQRGSFEH